MSFREAVNHYIGLIQSTPLIEEGLSWTVVRPLGESLSLPSVASRLIGGGRPTLVESSEEFDEEAEAVEGTAVYLDEFGDSIGLYEPGGFSYAAAVPVLEWLSEDAQVWHVSWNLTGRRFLEYAANGRRLAVIPGFDPRALHGEAPATLQDAAAALESVAGETWITQKAAVLAVIEARTGARLSHGWFDEPRQVALVDLPFSEETTPIGLWHHEPELDARLRLMPEEDRRAVLLRLIDVLIERFDLDLAFIAPAVRAAHKGLPIDAGLLEEVKAEWENLGRQWTGAFYAVRENDEPGWRRWVAANAIRHSLRSLNEGASFFDGLTYAKFALSEEWPATTDRILAATHLP
ncbi:hypothetical protein [Streptosporangium sp. NPDC002607]